MAYTLPDFNLNCSIYRAGNDPPNPADVSSPCNLALGRRQLIGVVSVNQMAPQLLLPPLTDIRDARHGQPNADHVEVPTGSNRWYNVVSVEDAGKGFPNEHRVAMILPTKLASWPLPMP
jgi:hypothetical protein